MLQREEVFFFSVALNRFPCLKVCHSVDLPFKSVGTLLHDFEEILSDICKRKGSYDCFAFIFPFPSGNVEYRAKPTSAVILQAPREVRSLMVIWLNLIWPFFGP